MRPEVASSSAPAPPGGLRERKKDRTRRQLALTALELFERQGYDRTTVEQITETVEVSRATFFRYFAAKEDVLFWDEEHSLSVLTDLVARRPDRGRTPRALAAPFVTFTEGFHDQSGVEQRRAFLIMTTKTLEGRSLRTRQRLERAVMRQLAHERGASEPDFDELLVAGLALSCYVAAMRRWRGEPGAALHELTRHAFDRAARLAGPASRAG